jgi:8-oxo-dGTP pyrophosphatase MutT (NUDIX family)
MITNIKKFLPDKLPGYSAHKQLLPQFRKYNIPKNIKPKLSAVNIITYPQDNNLFFVLTKRSNKLDQHSGQIAIPGGSFDISDTSLWNTAKREAFEETGIKTSDENFIIKLSNLYIEVSNFIVTPFVSFLNSKPKTKINPSEVDKIFFVNFNTFFTKNNLYFEKILKNNKSFLIPYFKLENEKVWGATAMILNEFYFVFKNFAQYLIKAEL